MKREKRLQIEALGYTKKYIKHTTYQLQSLQILPSYRMQSNSSKPLLTIFLSLSEKPKLTLNLKNKIGNNKKAKNERCEAADSVHIWTRADPVFRFTRLHIRLVQTGRTSFLIVMMDP